LLYRVLRDEGCDGIARNHVTLPDEDVANATLAQETADLILGQSHDFGRLLDGR